MKKIIHGIEITIVSDKKSLSERAARVVLEYIQSKSNTTTNLLVPTGTSPIELYALLSEQREALKNTRWFNMDEYVVKNMDGSFTFIDPQNETSYHYYMSQHLFKDGFSPESHFPGIENISHPGTYDRQIQALGGLDIAINAMGEDGHTFGFNSPPEAQPVSVTRLVELPSDTKEVNKGLTGLETPPYAVTIGLATGMSAKKIVMLVSGKRKANILKQVLEGEITPSIPATLLRHHPNCHWIVDEDAASMLSY